MFSYKQEVKQEIREFLKSYQNSEEFCLLLNAKDLRYSCEYYKLHDTLCGNIYDSGSATGKREYAYPLSVLQQRVRSNINTLGYYLEYYIGEDDILAETANILSNNNLGDWEELDRCLKIHVLREALEEILNELRTVAD